MLRIALICFAIFAIIAILKTMDFSKQGIVERKKKLEKFKQIIRRKITDPYNDTLMTKIPEGKRAKVEDRYRKAGLKINFAASFTFCLILGFALAFCSAFFLKNPYLAIAAFGFGWNIPGVIANFVSNKRLEKINNQVGMFMRMIIKRYQVLGDFYLAFESTVDDFIGEDPLYSELVMTLNNINRGESIEDCLYDLAYRTDNKFLRRFADYYAITSDIGTKEAREVVLGQALSQYETHMELSRELKKQLSELSMEAYIMLLFVPGVFVYQVKTDATYIPFMTTTLMGKLGLAIILAVWLLCFWVINVKLAAPIDKEE